MPVTNWNQTTINGQPFLVIDVASFRIPMDWDPSSNMFIAVAAPDGGLGNFPALVKGDPGTPATIDPVIAFTELDATDPTPASAYWTLEGTNEYKLTLALHEGADGPPGTSPLAVGAPYGTAAAGNIIVVNPAATGYVYQAQKVGDRFVPASIASTPAGNAQYTLCPVSIPAQPNDWRPQVSGQAIITPTGSNCQANLVARVFTGTGYTPFTGNIVGQGFGLPGVTDNVVLSSAPPPASLDAYDRVAAGTAAVVYLSVERQSGTDTFTTNATTTNFAVRVRPVP